MKEDGAVITDVKTNDLASAVTDAIVNSGTKPDVRSTLDNEPPPDHPRFKEIYGKMKEFEKQVEAMKLDKEQNGNMIDALKEHNTKLAEAVEKSMTKVSEAVTKKQEEDSISNEINSITTSITDIREQRKKAFSDADWDRADNLSELLDDAKSKLANLKKQKDTKIVVTNEKIKVSPEEASVMSESSKKIIDTWVADNKWYLEDPLMAGAALNYEAQKMKDSEWASKPIVERLAEIKKVVEERFGMSKGGNGATSAPSVDISSEAGSRQVISVTSLSSEQMAAARALGITPEDYAQQIKFINQEMEDRNNELIRKFK